MIFHTPPGRLLAALGAGALISIALSVTISAHPFAEAGISLNGATRVCGALTGGAENRAAFTSLLAVLFGGIHLLPAVRSWRHSGRASVDAALLLESQRIPLGDGRLALLAEDFGIANSLALIDSQEPFAFTLGTGQPRIYVSRVAADLLDDEELAAVLLHERHHFTHGDAFQVRRVLAIQAMLGHLPGVKSLAAASLCDREFAADDNVVAATGKSVPLLRAFLKLQPSAAANGCAIGYMDFAVHRVNRLIYSNCTEAGRASNVVLAAFGALVLPPLVTLLLTEPHLAMLLRQMFI